MMDLFLVYHAAAETIMLANKFSVTLRLRNGFIT